MDAGSAGAPFLGVVMLDTRFPRRPGDIGNPVTWQRAGIPVRYRMVPGASPSRTVLEADPSLIEPFIDAARVLAREGAALISTSCGFLAAYQSRLASAVPVPVVSSSLLQCRRHARPGILTIAASALTPAILAEAGVPAGTPIADVAPDGEFARPILSNATTMDAEAAGRDLVSAAVDLVRRHPQIDHLVLECTNMPPWRAAIADATGRPVHDIETLLIEAWPVSSARR